MSNADQIYSNGLIKVIGVFANVYKNNEEAGIKLIGRQYSVARVLLIDMYSRMVKDKILQPVEELDKESKRELWDKCKGFEDPLTVCRMVHFLNMI